LSISGEYNLNFLLPVLLVSIKNFNKMISETQTNRICILQHDYLWLFYTAVVTINSTIMCSVGLQLTQRLA